MTERPNRKTLSDALDIYRDAMRPFIIRCLKRVRGGSVEELLKATLRDESYNRLEEYTGEGGCIEDVMDVSDFPRIVAFYWSKVFRDAFSGNDNVRDALYRIVDARNKVSHPHRQDINREYAEQRLRDIASVLTEINEPHRSKAVKSLRDALVPFAVTAHRFQQGGREVYAFTLDIETLDWLLPDRVDEKVVKDANRPLTQSHADKILKYLRDRDDWLLGALLLGISPDAVQFHSYASEPDTDISVGRLTIHTDGPDRMMMFDGQHRRRAIKNVLADLSHGERHKRKLSCLKEASMPVMLYVEDNIEALQQMFADAAKTRAIERNTVTRFDQRDAFNRAALWIAKNSDLFAGRVEMERASVSRHNRNIIAINQLAMTLRTLEVGYGGRVSSNRNDEYMLDIESLHNRCWTWADDFMPAAREEYSDLMAGEIDNADIPDKRAETMAYNATVIRILAGCYHEWTKNGDDWKPLARFIREASLRPGASKGSLLVDAGVVAPGGTSPFAQQSLVVGAIDHVVQQAQQGTTKPPITVTS